MSSKLPAQSAGRALQLTSDGPETGSLTYHQHDRDTLCSAEVVIVIFHGNTILGQRVLHLVIERALYRHHIEQRRIPFRFKGLVTALGDIGGEVIEKPRLTPDQYQKLIQFFEDDSERFSSDFKIDTNSWLKSL
ncbi:hypothetical protein [Marinobacter sp.]|uniref:hypothetical protein n=1 Tax=Marinobacter sp. TaxID=50741 RepID=UPI00384BF0EA